MLWSRITSRLRHREKSDDFHMMQQKIRRHIEYISLLFPASAHGLRPALLGCVSLSLLASIYIPFISHPPPPLPTNLPFHLFLRRDSGLVLRLRRRGQAKSPSRPSFVFPRASPAELLLRPPPTICRNLLALQEPDPVGPGAFCARYRTTVCKEFRRDQSAFCDLHTIAHDCSKRARAGRCAPRASR